MAEVKTFEAENFVVTTERFVWGTRVIPLSDIDQFATPFVEREWKATFIIAGIGLAMLMWGGTLLKVIGFLLLPAAVGYFLWATDRNLVMKVGEEYVHIKVKTNEVLYGLAGAINKEIKDRRDAHTNALRADIASLPTA